MKTHRSALQIWAAVLHWLLAAAGQGCTASEVLVLFISVDLRVVGGHGGQQSSALSRQSYQICAPDNTMHNIARIHYFCTHYKAVMYKCMCIQ